MSENCVRCGNSDCLGPSECMLTKAFDDISNLRAKVSSLERTLDATTKSRLADEAYLGAENSKLRAKCAALTQELTLRNGACERLEGENVSLRAKLSGLRGYVDGQHLDSRHVNAENEKLREALEHAHSLVSYCLGPTRDVKTPHLQEALVFIKAALLGATTPSEPEAPLGKDAT